MMKILIVHCLMLLAVPGLQIQRSLIINQEEFTGLEDKMGEILSDLERQSTDALSRWQILSRNCR